MCSKTAVDNDLLPIHETGAVARQTQHDLPSPGVLVCSTGMAAVTPATPGA
jgi:hypothetical protein